MKLQFFCTWIYLTFLGLTESLAQAFQCPPLGSIEPCYCYSTSNLWRIDCSGPTVTQEVIQNAVDLTKLANGLNDSDSSEFLSLSAIGVYSTDLTQLDLSPFFGTNLTALTIYQNKQLTSIVGPPLSDLSPSRSIRVQDLTMQYNALTDEGLGLALKYFDPTLLTRLTLYSNQLEGDQYSIDGDNSGDVEFLPGLSAFKNLEELNLGYNNIFELVGGQFKRNSRLTSLNLVNNNLAGRGGFGDGAFLVDNDESSHGNNESFVLFLTYAGLIDEDFSNENDRTGLLALSRSRPVDLRLQQNNLEFLSKQNFEPFLQVNEGNQLDLNGNPLQCDERMKWLKDGQDEWKNRVKNANCANDPGKTVWDSDLIS